MISAFEVMAGAVLLVVALALSAAGVWATGFLFALGVQHAGGF